MQRRVYTEAGESEVHHYYLAGTDFCGWRVIRHRVRLDYGRRQCERGLWREVFNETTCELEGFRLLSVEELKGDEAIATMGGSTSAINRHEMEINADGRSCTIHLCEEDRLERKQPEDFIERTWAKISVWPKVGAERGDILRAWPTQVGMI